MQAWWSRQSTRNKVMFVLGAIVLAYVIVSPKSASDAPTTAVASSTARVTTATALPTSITGMKTADIEGNAKAKGLSCGAPKTGTVGGASAQIVDCIGTVSSFVVGVSYVSTDSTHVRLMTASITPAGSAATSVITEAAAAYLSFFATMPYTGADPTRAQDWVKANVGTPGATMTIGSAFFEIDPTPSDVNSKRLNIVAVGAR